MENSIITTNSFIAPAADIETALHRYQAVKDFIGKVLREGTDYGKMPGSDKPTLLKPGAEKMCTFFGFTVEPILQDKVEDWTGKNYDGEPFFYYRYSMNLYRDGKLIASGEGSANSWEVKYRYRNAEKSCPNCGQASIFKSKNKPEFYCWAKRGGCGATFPLNDKRITDQESGKVKNPDPADLVNTLQKMAQKRALVATVLIATNTSEYFTQDIEDFIDVKVRDITPEPAAPAIKYPSDLLLETNSQGVFYTDLPTATLAYMINEMRGLIAKNGLEPEKLLEYERKIDVASKIIELRK